MRWLCIAGLAAALHLATPASLAATPEPESAPAPTVNSASETPAAPEPQAPVQAARAVTPGVGIGPSDDPNIDAPMTYTADNVPPPQKEGAPAQVAGAQPDAATPVPSPALRPATPPLEPQNP
jgi:hypothetical protein